MVTKVLAAAAAVTLAAAPAMAASNPASGLSLSNSVKSARVAAITGKKNKALSGGVIALIVIAVGGAIGGIVAATSSSR